MRGISVLSWLARAQDLARREGITKRWQACSRTWPGASSRFRSTVARWFKGHIALCVPPEHRELAMEAAEQGLSLNRLISKKLSA